MDVFEAIKKRRSIRNYSDKKISNKKIERLLVASREAPSAKNLQPWKLLIVTGKKMKKELVSACYNQAFISDAGAFIVGLTEDEKWADIDLAIALDHLSLEAVELDLGTCWIGAFKEDKIKEIIDIPEGYEITICMTVGYPKKIPEKTVKKSIDELAIQI
ncbi:MAG: nitroreductase family protein [Thermoplasmatota archaeon]